MSREQGAANREQSTLTAEELDNLGLGPLEAPRVVDLLSVLDNVNRELCLAGRVADTLDLPAQAGATNGGAGCSS
ncbi:MAG: hypothetical protein KF861_09930 [Planctomycetaceae bacterium]|nr:hypothetical protein [Planctomycetaceae bacterium]